MIDAQAFIEPARQIGFHCWAGVPCSYLKPFINYVIEDADLKYVSAANEGDALSLASGYTLAGTRAVAMMQNSGLGNAVSPLTSLNWVFRIPVLIIVTLRGDPDGSDEPQHELMGQRTVNLLEAMDLPWAWFPDREEDIGPVLETAVSYMDSTGRPFALVMRKGSVAPHLLNDEIRPRAGRNVEAAVDLTGDRRPTREAALRALVESTHDDGSVVIGTTGFTGRELFAIADRPNHLYVVGSMGCASSLGLGLAMARPDLRVFVADGDGAALMRLGNLATVGAYGSENFRHLLLDNGLHESTGGQATVSDDVHFARIAAACGYAHAVESDSLESLTPWLSSTGGPSMLHLRIRPGVPDGLPRPDVAPQFVTRRLMNHIGSDAPWLRLS